MFRERLRLGAVIAAYAASVAAYAWLPARIPPHLALGGELDWWAGRAFIALLLPTAALVVCLLYRRLTAGDPLRDSYPAFRGTFDLVLDAGVLFIVAVHVLLLGTILAGPSPWMRRLPPLMAGLTLVVVGNVLPRIRPNLALGIRTPWTLRSDRVWAQTHRVGGYVVVTFGALLLVDAAWLFSWLGYTIVVGVFASFAVPVVASYLLWRREERQSQVREPEGSRRA